MGFIKKTIKRLLLLAIGFFVIIFIVGALSGGKENNVVENNLSASPTSGIKENDVVDKIPPTSPTSGGTKFSSTKFGTYFSPRNFPTSFLTQDQNLIDQYFKDTAEIGNHTAFLMRWDEPELADLTKKIFDQAKNRGLKVHIHLDPLTGWSHAKAAPPKPLDQKSFSDTEVREAFKKRVLEIAAWKPDVLGIGTEVNLMLHEKNEKEFADYVSLSKETYVAIKKAYPKQTVTLSFAWDVMRWDNQYSILSQFKDSVDVYSFTTYPNVLTVPNQVSLQNNFFADIRKYLPNERIAISEIAFFSGGSSSEKIQADYYLALPELLKGVKPEFITQFTMYDFPSSFVSDERFRTLGIRNEDGSEKKVWQVLKQFFK